MTSEERAAGEDLWNKKIRKKPAESKENTDPWEAPIPRDKSLEPPRLQLWKTVTCAEVLPEFFPDCKDRYKVYWVDGFYIRNTIAVDFDDGGNHEAYPDFMPAGEIWIEINGDTKDVRDEEMILLHETYEAHIIVHEGTSYEEAHGMAQHVERLTRKKYADPTFHGPKEGQK